MRFDDEDEHESRTELDSHANMPVVGRNSYVISDTGKMAEVNPYNPDYKSMRLPIVDAAIQYDCPYTGEIMILIIRNAILVQSMKNNLLPPFALREAGIVVNETPKIQSKDPLVEDHSLFFKETDVRIPLSLWGIFSYFPTTKPKEDTLQDTDNIYVLTPSFWNPHDNSYAKNEESMLDWEGNISQKSKRKTIMLSEVEEDEQLVHDATISSSEISYIDSLRTQPNEQPCPCHQHIPAAANEVSQHLAGVSPVLVDEMLYEGLERRNQDGEFMMSIGSTDVGTEDSSLLLNEIENNSIIDESELFDSILEGQVEIGDGDADDLDELMISSINAESTTSVSPEHLSKIWRIDIPTARKTLDITTQHRTHVDNPTLSRNYNSNDRMLCYKRIAEYFFSDTFFATSKSGKSTRGNTCCQLFVTDKGYLYIVPMRRRSDVLQAFKQFAKDLGAPDAIIVDMSGEQTTNDLRRFCNDIGTKLKALEEGTPWSNKAELYIGLLKEAVRKDMRESNCPLALWDYCAERRVRINNLTARNIFKLHGTNSHTSLLGEEGDISNLCRYGWYEWCYFRERKAQFPFNKEILGRVLGPARGAGNEMAQWILKSNGNVVPRRTVRPLTVAEFNSSVEIKKRATFDALIERRWGTAISPPPKQSDAQGNNNGEEHDDMELYTDEEEEPRLIPEIEDAVDASGNHINQQPLYDRLINAEVQMQNGDDIVRGYVRRRAIGPDGKTSGVYDHNPHHNSIVYEVEFPDGDIKEYAANVIAENMIRQVDSDGFSLTLMEGIVDYKMDKSLAVAKEDGYVTGRNGRKKLRKTTVGWKLLVRWKDKSETWVPLKDMKESHPVEVAEFATARGIDDQPAFRWWVPYTLRKRDVIISAVRSRIRKTTHKYGIELPTSVEHAYDIDRRNGNTFWRDAISKEMTNVGIAFEILDHGVKPPSGWNKVTGHFVFDVKMTFERKARWVLDGHKTPDPIVSTFAGVVSRESVRIALTYAALNELTVCAGDIRNAYLQAPSSQKDFVVCGAEFGLENKDKYALIHRALYGGKSAGRDFRNHLCSCMMHLNFVSCPADPDVWMRPAKHSNGRDYYEYCLLYVDDVLCISENSDSILHNELGKYFELKNESIGPPSQYLGAGMREVELENGSKAWAASSSQYVKAAVANVKKWLETHGNWRLPTKSETPIQTSYRPEIDVTPELPPEESSYYQSLIGILRWIVELGRVDVCLEVSMMSSHVAMPREGHLNQVLHIFAYLDKYHNTEIVYDPSPPYVDPNAFSLQDWTSSEFGHVSGKEEVPLNMPEARGFGFVMSAKVDADHAGDTITRRSRTGFLVYLNSALVYWTSKKQTSVESSSFGSEFIAMKQCCEYLRGLRYKLRMMGIPCDGPSYIFGDNQSVLVNSSIPSSVLKKKSQSIAYHFVREGVARDEWRVSYINTSDNEADLLTKVMPSNEKRRNFVRNILHHIFRS